MKRFTFLLLLINVAIASNVRSQMLSPMVLSPSGAYQTAGGYSISSTVGELTMVQTFSTGSYILTQGFQQPEGLFLLIPSVQVPGFNTEIYPNPGSGHFYLSATSPQESKLQIRVINLLGQSVYSEWKSQMAGCQVHEIYLTDLPGGIYLATASLFDTNGHELYKSSGRIQLVH